MKRSTMFPLAIGIAALAIAAFPSRRAAADDETDDVQIKIQAPLDAADCAAIPPTITVLGLTIGVSNATIEVQNGGGGDSGGSDDGGGSGDSGGSGDGGGSGQSGCAALVAGQSVEVDLASDSTPLAATAVKQDDSNEQDIQVEGPIQAVNTTAPETITVLGLAIDVSGANLSGADDDSTDGSSQPIGLTQLIVGQFVEVQLASSTAPLAATELQLKNFTNQVTVEVDNPSGQEVDDVDANGNPIDDVQVDVTETVPVRNAAPGAAPTTGRRIRRLQFHTRSNGSFTLSGLPTGRIKMTVTRGTARALGSVLVRGNTTRSARVRLRPTRR